MKKFCIFVLINYFIVAMCSQPTEMYNDTDSRQLGLLAFPVGLLIGSIGGSLLFSTSTTTTTTTTTTTMMDDPGGFPSLIQNQQPDAKPDNQDQEEFTKPRTKLEDYPNCGEKGSQTRIIGGQDVRENEYPWLCSLKFRGSHICGLTLISAPPYQTILVGAAHCYASGDRPSEYTVICGEHNLKVKDKYEVEMNVIEVIQHENFRSASRTGYDIAIYKVIDKPLRGNVKRKKIYPACLPEIDRSYAKTIAIVTGWGVTQTRLIRGQPIKVKALPDVAKHVEVRTTACRDRDLFNFPNGLVCAADIGKDSCQGDSGGPLMAESTKQSSSKIYSWIGIVSFGVGCAREGYPGAYTRTSCYLDWIARNFGLNTSSTTPNKSSDWSTRCPGVIEETLSTNLNSGGFLSDSDIIIVENDD